ncbi:hypothetical protein AVEN_185891-1 [Araneus ventricosus]|uniref:Uncharacterized protein n=1 Tax=Araneus ventricosus TaxID=182803 RepID=A0A4Y2VPL1_ARAVE|nr:hypothetical protein AVEN_185891-1 [Araneus ventricosus]
MVNPARRNGATNQPIIIVQTRHTGIPAAPIHTSTEATSAHVTKVVMHRRQRRGRGTVPLPGRTTHHQPPHPNGNAVTGEIVRSQRYNNQRQTGRNLQQQQQRTATQGSVCATASNTTNVHRCKHAANNSEQQRHPNAMSEQRQYGN